jgi:hypothetical protein
MPRRRNKDDDDKDDGSEASTADLAKSEDAEESDVTEGSPEERRGKVSACVGDMDESRTSTREAALQGLTAVLKDYHDDLSEFLDEHSEELGTRVIACLKKGGSEGRLAADCLSHLFLILGPGGQGSEIWARSGSKLKLVASRRDQDSDKAAQASASALSAFALGTRLFESDDAPVIEAALEVCAGLAVAAHSGSSGHVGESVRVAALQGWCLLAGAVPLLTRAKLGGETLLPTVAFLLAPEGCGGGGGGGGAGLRIEAGALAALLAEARFQAREEVRESRRNETTPVAFDALTRGAFDIICFLGVGRRVHWRGRRGRPLGDGA